MKKTTKLFIYLIPTIILGLILINSDLIEIDSENLTISDMRMVTSPNLNVANVELIGYEENSQLPESQPANELSTNLVFIPSSYDFKERSETTVQYYGFQLKNLGSTTVSGQPVCRYPILLLLRLYI